MAAADLLFTEEDMSIDGAVGYPKAFAKLCRDRSFGPYSHGPLFNFTPYSLPPQEAMRAKELDDLFPVVDPKAKPTAKPKMFVSLIWKQLNHLGNAGFDPATFRVDPYGNVLYFYADSASPLAWDIDHWFPCSRGGSTVPSNLRILQWQVCKKKHNKLEFLIPWWDLQVGISVNQFLSVFASSNSDFRHRAFSQLFADGESEELNASQTVDSHSFPHHFEAAKNKVGLAPAAVVFSRREFIDTSTLRSLDINRRPWSNSPIIAARKLKTGMAKENENPDMVTNPYQAIVLARDSLKQREETTKMQTEIQKLDDEVNELKQKTEEERISIQDLELVLIKRRQRAEKCHRLAEAQSSYRAMLEKMIRDAMHRSVVYKEQVRLNHTASNALMAQLQAQKAICDSSERELHNKFKQRDELEKQIRPEWEQARKRSRTDETLHEEKDEKTVLYLPGSKPRSLLENKLNGNAQEDDDDNDDVLCLPGINSRTLLHKELRVFLEEEHKASEPGSYFNEETGEQTLHEEKDEKNVLYLPGSKPRSLLENKLNGNVQEDDDDNDDVLCLPGINSRTLLHKELRVFLEEEHKASEAGSYFNEETGEQSPQVGRKEAVDDDPIVVVTEDEKIIKDKLQKLRIGEGMLCNTQFPAHEPEGQEDNESRKERGKGNVEKWLQILLDGTDQNSQIRDTTCKTDEIIRKLNLKYLQKEIKILRLPESQDMEVKDCEEIHQQSIQKKDATSVEEERVEMEAYRKEEGEKNEETSDIEARKILLKDPPYRLISEKSNANEMGCVDKAVGSRPGKSGKEKGLKRSESAISFRRIPSSPSLILGMRKGVDCIGKKPLVTGDDDADGNAESNYFKSSIKMIKKAVFSSDH